jgi:hypothetical protein
MDRVGLEWDEVPTYVSGEKRMVREIDSKTALSRLRLVCTHKLFERRDQTNPRNMSTPQTIDLELPASGHELTR